MNYTQKYFKYKNKYLKLKNQEINYNFLREHNSFFNSTINLDGGTNDCIENNECSQCSEHSQGSPKWTKLVATNFCSKIENNDDDKNIIQKYNNDILIYHVVNLHRTQKIEEITEALKHATPKSIQNALEIATKKKNICWSQNKNPKYKIYDEVVKLLIT